MGRIPNFVNFVIQIHQVFIFLEYSHGNRIFYAEKLSERKFVLR